MTIGQILFDALTFCRYFAVTETIGRPEVKLVFLEAFQYAYDQAILFHPEYYEKSVAFAGTSINLPSDFRMETVLLVNDAGCTAGYAKVVDNTEWDWRMTNTRLKPTLDNPYARKEATQIIVSPSITGGSMFYLRNFSESDFTDETQDLMTFLPLVYHPLLLGKMQELIQVRHFKLADSPKLSERQMALLRVANKTMKRTLKPLEVIEGVSEKPMTVAAAGRPA